jgi:hypothetical protein
MGPTADAIRHPRHFTTRKVQNAGSALRAVRCIPLDIADLKTQGVP